MGGGGVKWLKRFQVFHKNNHIIPIQNSNRQTYEI